MPEKKANIKIKIFMVALLLSLCIIFGFYSFNLLSANKSFINEKTDLTSKCLNLDFKFVSIENEGDNLKLTIRNIGVSEGNIEKVSIIKDSKVISKDTSINPYQTNTIIFNDLNVNGGELVYLNECNDFSKTININMVG